MEDNRDSDKKVSLYPMNSRRGTTLDQIKSLYIAEGKSAEEIADITRLDLTKIKALIDGEKLSELRKAYIRNGLQNIQNKQLAQAEKLMDIETNFKKLRIIQLENQLKDFVAYYERHGDFYKRHPKSGEILHNTNGMPMQISIPNVTREIRDLKESVSLSEGMKTLLDRFDEVINSKQVGPKIDEKDVIDLQPDDFKKLFKRTEEKWV